MRRVMDMHEIRTKRLLLRPFRESDYDDLFEFLSQLADDEFEGYPRIIYENGQEHLKYRLGSEEFYAIELTESGKVIAISTAETRILRQRKSAISSTNAIRRKAMPPKRSPQ